MKSRLLVGARLGLCLVGAAVFAGCGGDSNIGSVSGTVTLDGAPVTDALVSFSPKKGGSPSMARTDSSGRYTLHYNRAIDGAEIGEHTVKVTTYKPAIPDGDPPQVEVAEKIPLKYNHETQLTKEVKSGSNTIDFEFKTADGPVVQPKILEAQQAQRDAMNRRGCGY